MDKKIGNLFLIVMFFAINVLHAKQPNIDIKIMDKYQQPIEQAEIGVPFILQVTCQNFNPRNGLQGLEDAQGLMIQSAGSTQLTKYVNGRTLQEDYIFNYAIVSKIKGTFELGPITAQDEDGNTISSEKIEIEVGDIAQVQHKENDPYILDIECLVERIYVGQKLKIYVNFCYLTGFSDLRIENTLDDDVSVGHQDKHWKATKKLIGSKEYSCQQMCIEVFSKKVGTLIIPSFKATFIADQRQDIGLLGFFGFANSKVIESRPKQLTVLPLPESEKYKNVQAVGKFKTASLTIDPKKGQVGEGIHAKMIVQGDGNLNIIPHPELILPEGIHCYEGNSSFERIDDTMSKKTFDWILQSDYPGNFTIEAQNFVYFDPTDTKYKELHTKPVELSIEGVTVVKQDKVEEVVSQEPEKKEEAKALSQEQQEAKQETKYYSTQKFYHNSSSLVLTWWIMFLVIVILVLFLVMLMVPLFKKIFFIETLSYRWLFWKYSKSADVQAIYQLFEKMAYDYGFGLQSEELYQAFLKNKLSDESFENWKNFLHMLLEFNFAFHKSVQDKALVIDLAKQWFSIILLCCKTLKNK